MCPNVPQKGEDMTLKTARLNMRVRPETKQMLKEEAAALNLSVAALARIKLGYKLPDYAYDVLTSPIRQDWQPIGGGGGCV